MLKLKAAAAATVLVLLGGCNSIESTIVATDASGKSTFRKVAGVPITVTMPEKLGFFVTDIISGGKVIHRTIDKTPVQIGKSQLVYLDTKRPIYGMGKGMIQLDKERQYPTQVSNDVDDKTLGRILDSADNLLEKVGRFAEDQKNLPEGPGTNQKQYLLIYDLATGQFSCRPSAHCSI